MSYSLQSDPRFRFQDGGLLDDPEYVGHLFDGDHLLLPLTVSEVTDPGDGLLDVSLFVRLHVDHPLDSLGGHHGFDLERLKAKRIQSEVDISLATVLARTQSELASYKLIKIQDKIQEKSTNL